MKRLFIAGAPKCGTTSLAYWLGEHPEIAMSSLKEPHYFSTDLLNRQVVSNQAYQALFKHIGPSHTVVAEASTWYLYSRDAITNIERRYHDDARYIVMTRDPIDMFQSLHAHNVRTLNEDCDDPELAWRLQDQRARGHLIPRTCTEPAFVQYRAACSLGTLLERLQGAVAAARVLVLALDDLRQDVCGTYGRVLRFLGVRDDGRQEFPVLNEAREHRSRFLQHLIRAGGRARIQLGLGSGLGLSRWNERAPRERNISESFRTELEAVFAKERIKIANFVEASLTKWK
jgi:hypothetical protein